MMYTLLAKHMATLCLTGVLLVYTAEATDENRPMQGCRQPDDRCVPVRFCTRRYQRARTVLEEHSTADAYQQQQQQQQHGHPCQPEVADNETPHICCPNASVRCRLDGSALRCKRPAECRSLRHKTDHELKHSNVTQLCYTHNKQNYFCCPDEHCPAGSKRCAGVGKRRGRILRRFARTASNEQASAFGSCSSDGNSVLVPKSLCDYEYTYVRGTSKACCKLHPTDMLISHPKAAAMVNVKCAGDHDSVVGLRIGRGTEATQSEFPWMVQLVYQERVIMRCSGTLVHPRYVLTAKHCVDKYEHKLVKVRLGVHYAMPLHYVHLANPCDSPDQAAIYCPLTMQEISIEQKIVHSERNHDVALLKLRQAANIVPDVVEPICLPIMSRLLTHLPLQLCISGWGKTDRTPSVSAPGALLKANVSVLPEHSDCPMDYEFCAGGINQSNTCLGDSGGPYQAKSTYIDSQRYVQYGVIAGGSHSCDAPDRPSKAMLLAYFLPWMLDVMELE